MEMDSSLSPAPAPPVPSEDTGICGNNLNERGLSFEEIESKTFETDHSDMGIGCGNTGGYGSGNAGGGAVGGSGQGKDSPLDSYRSEQDSALEDFAWTVFKESGLLGEIKGQLVQFLEDSGRLNMSNIKPDRANSQLLQWIYEYLTWVGMSRSATMIVSESPVDFETTLLEENKAESVDGPKLVKMFTIATSRTQHDNELEVNPLKSATASETFLVKPNDKAETLVEPEAFGVDDQIHESDDEEEVEEIFDSEKAEPPSESEKAGQTSESEKVELPPDSQIKQVESQPKSLKPEIPSKVDEVVIPSFKFPEIKVLDNKYRVKLDSFDDDDEKETPEEETKSYSESFDVEDSNVESTSHEEEEHEEKQNIENEPAHQKSFEPQSSMIPDMKLEEKESDTQAQIIPPTSFAIPQGQASDSHNDKSQFQSSERLATDGEDSMSSLMDILAISENTEDMSINSDSIGITSCEHRIDLDRLN